MNDDVFFDTNTLIYAISAEGERRSIAEELLLRGGTISVQVLNELTSVARRKLKWSWGQIGQVTGQIHTLCEILPLSVATHSSGRRLAERYGYNIYESLILASALEARCDVVYSEDMQDGQRIESLHIRNPFP